ncbi:hypothetical protein AMAG_02042 [Allomyces macrogynus ATCC 38327]|uniref:Uncharacterized protein n=1 Tax=Allomyces macrogynus (strain ATCC 38327) TaxID=578462 RepID=A0A0L0S0X8_ALLM3|nr:hypothetical protein AMAG_02042 [Allomyces macrogynus ATCC 38327]|eukprot:KNE56208.1 hypothetical protein AMAG_02042 [Allomyces macrogynus ATCC 38327]
MDETTNQHAVEERDQPAVTTADSPNAACSSPTRPDPRAALDALSSNFDQAAAPAPAKSSGWGWASWGASLVTSAVRSLEQLDVNQVASTATRLGSTVTQAATKSIDRVYATLDPEFQHDEAAQPSASTDNDASAGSSDAQRERATAEPDAPAAEDEVERLKVCFFKLSVRASRLTSEIVLMQRTAGHAAETVMSSIDKTLDFASDLLGNAVLTGYRTVASETSKATKRVEELAADPTLSQAVAQSRGLASQGIGALEQLGKTAFDVISGVRPTAESSASRSADTGPAASVDRAAAPASSLSAPTNADVPLAGLQSLSVYFELAMGAQHLEALQTIASETQVKLAANPQAAVPDYVAKCKTLDEQLNLEPFLDTLDQDTQITNEFDELAAAAQKLDMHGTDQAVDQLKQLTAAARESRDHATVRQHLAEFTALACEQLLRAAEELLLKIAAEESVDAVAAASALRTIVTVLLQGLQVIGNLYSADLDGSNETLSPDQIDDDTSMSMSFVQEAMEAVATVLKLALSRLVGQTESVSNKEIVADAHPVEADTHSAKTVELATEPKTAGSDE